jgi:hypothetical protein
MPRFLDDPVMQAVQTGNRESNSRAHVSGGMPKKPIKIEIILEGDGRFLLKVYSDGSEERVPIVKLPRKPPRFRYRTVTLDKSRK